MRLRRLEIENFRGVKTLDWRHIAETTALVGPGDSCKSTILDAIERLLSPKWNASFDDTDFWELNIESPILIRATITELDPIFYRDSKYGLFLQAFDQDDGKAVRAEGSDDEHHALVVELRVEANLEPEWNVIDAAGATHRFNARDREELGLLRVGGYVDQHFGWSKGSVLTRLTDTGDAARSVLADATRQARAGLSTAGLWKLNEAAQKVEELGKNLGVALQNALIPFLDASALSVAAGTLSLHDGKIPVRRAGLGTRRLLAVAMQHAAAKGTGLRVVDEFEQGLEPHRIRRLLRVLRGLPPEGKERTNGQLILTTHSPTVLSELDAAEVAITRRAADGSVTVNCLPDAVAYVLTRTPEALLARKVIVAEGATEVGICSALDEAWSKEIGASFAYRGVSVVDGRGGTQPAEIAGNLENLGYEVAILIDSDAKAKAGKAAKATVLTWPGGLCTEQRLAMDLPIDALKQMVAKAATTAKKGMRSVRDAIAEKLEVSYNRLADGDPESWVEAIDVTKFRTAFGTIAKQKQHGWFKSSDQGAFLGGLITKYWTAIDATPTHALISELRSYVHG